MTLLLSATGCRFQPFAESPPDAAAAPGQETGRDRGELLAIVGSREITAGDLEDAILARYYGKRALLGLIREELFRREALRLGLTVTDAEVEARVDAEIQALMRETGENLETLEQELARTGLGLAQHKRDLRREFRNVLLMDKVTRKRRERSGLTEKSIRDEYQRTHARSRRLLRHIAFPADASPRDADSFTKALERAREQAETVLDRLKRGESFAELAQVHSGNRGSGRRGGLYGWIDEETLRDPGLTEAVFSLPVGTPSEPSLQNHYGYHIFLVEERRDPRPLPEVRGEIEALLLQAPPTEEEIQSVVAALRARTPVVVLLGDDGENPETDSAEATNGGRD